MKRKPLGVMPKDIWEYNRLIDLINCIERHIKEFEPIQEEWVQEYHELIAKFPQDELFDRTYTEVEHPEHLII